MTPRKLLIADHNSKPKPKPGPPATPPNSTSSSSTTVLPYEKRTRDLPNFSDCHCCGTRINYTNPKDRLQPLDSVWRIVLLCRKCSKNVQSGQTCPYCFKETGNSGNIFKCRDCGRRIHQDCVRNYGECTPWCYLGRALGFRVCVDCWVPDLLKNSVRIHRRSDNKDVMKSCAVGDLKNCPRNVKKVECEALKRVKMVAIGEEKALRNSVATKNAVELSENALVVADKNGKNGENISCSDAVEVVDDVELAIQLHRSMNSSPRILRNKCTQNSSCFQILNSRESDSWSSRRSGLGGNNGEGWNPNRCINDMDSEQIMRTNENDSPFYANKFRQGLLTYKRDRTRKLWHAVGDDVVVVVSESISSQQNDLQYKLQSNGSKSGCQLRFNGDVYKRDKKRKLWQVHDDSDVVSKSIFNHQADFKHNLHLKGAESWCSLNNGDLYMRHKNRKLLQVDDDSVMVSESKFNQQDLEWPLYRGDEIERFRQEPIIYKRSRFKWKSCQENGEALVFGECNSDVYTRVAFEPQNHQQDDLKHELPLRDTRDSCPVKCDAEIMLSNGSWKEEPDRYFFKYGPRRMCAKSGSNCETKQHTDAIQNENQTLVSAFDNTKTSWLVKYDERLILSDGSLCKEARYHFKYGQRVTGSKSGPNVDINLHSDDLHKENQASAPGLTVNSSSKSGTVSDASFDSYPVNLQASTSVNCPSVEEL